MDTQTKEQALARLIQRHHAETGAHYVHDIGSGRTALDERYKRLEGSPLLHRLLDLWASCREEDERAAVMDLLQAQTRAAYLDALARENELIAKQHFTWAKQQREVVQDEYDF